jgi:cytochrome bd-type quinol oxidase subunit 1
MNYPVWEVPLLGGGMLIAAIAVLHVFISHFAVGGGLFLALTERKAYREGDTELLAYTRKHSTFFVLLTLVLGAVTGVGIWWTIGLVHPTGTSALIHIFVWGWAIEWTFFVVEIAAALFYVYGWDRLEPRTHLIFGWIYFAGAWLSLLVINGILTFMVTPGRWLENQSFWSAYFNPAMLPSLLMRTGVCVALAGLYSLLTSSLMAQGEFRHRVTRYAAKWILAGTAVLPVGALWFMASLPPLARQLPMGGAAPVMIFTALGVTLSAIIVAFSFFGPYLRPQQFGTSYAALLLVLGIMVTGATEMVREAVRKPFIIYDYMYLNHVRATESDAVTRTGVLKSALWSSEKEVTPHNRLAAGEEVFRLQCRSCHTLRGYNGVLPLMAGWDEAYTDYQLSRLSTLKPYMPPFMGTPEERAALAAWLARLAGPPSPPPDALGVDGRPAANALAPAAELPVTEVKR